MIRYVCAPYAIVSSHSAPGAARHQHQRQEWQGHERELLQQHGAGQRGGRPPEPPAGHEGERKHQ